MREEEDEKLEVWVLSAPHLTPYGEELVSALARVFGIELSMAVHIAQHAPIRVKRGVGRHDAERLRATLEALGAGVEVVASSVRPSAWPPGLPPDSLQVATAPRPALLPSEWLYPSPPPRPSARPSSSAPSSLRPTAPPTVRTWTPLPPQTPRVSMSAGRLFLAVAAAMAVAMAGLTHWLRGVGDAQMLGNTPNRETSCGSHYGLTGPGIEGDRRARLTIIVAWRTGCLSDDYRQFLQNLADTHRGELEVIGAGLAPSGRDSRTLGGVSAPPPDPWPPRDCEPGFGILPTSRGIVSDSLSPPATYLYDDEGSLIAVWRGGMSPLQRDRLTAWIDGRGW